MPRQLSSIFLAPLEISSSAVALPSPAASLMVPDVVDSSLVFPSFDNMHPATRRLSRFDEASAPLGTLQPPSRTLTSSLSASACPPLEGSSIRRRSPLPFRLSSPATQHPVPAPAA